jgi:replication factor C subunit 3/5
LERNNFPNLLFYGPPGTGKTTTIINLINEYQQRYHQTSKGSIIHLNASDERGIDIIRNQILQFVKSRNFFEQGIKFVILDEVDYMTKNAQYALKYLLQSYCYNVRFCLICNYISKIDDSLKNEFVCIRFNQLPKQDIYTFIKAIATHEKLDISDVVIDTIQKTYFSDIRSMINFIQLHQNSLELQQNIITEDSWHHLHGMILGQCSDVIETIHAMSIQYNIDKQNILKKYFDYLIRFHPSIITPRVLDICEVVMHSSDVKIEHVLQYCVYELQDHFRDQR